MTVTEYERTWEDNELFGLNDMKTENYQSEEHAGGGGDEQSGSAS